MRNVWAIAKRELRQYFVSPVAYAMGFMLFLVLGIIFAVNLAGAIQFQSPPQTQSTIGPLVTLLLFITPAITMRLVADEQRMGTIELLLTAPVRDWELVMGKWLGALGFIGIILALTWVYPLVLHSMTEPGIDQGPLMSAYLGLVLLVSSLLAIGVFVSSLFSNVIAAFLTTLGVSLALWIVRLLADYAPGPAAEIVRYLDLSGRFFDNLFRGVVDTSDIVYYVSLTALGLFLATRVVEARRYL